MTRRACGFVERVATDYPPAIFVVAGWPFPQPDKSACGSGRWRRAHHGPSANLYFDHRERHADQGYGVNAVSGADVDHPIEVLD